MPTKADPRYTALGTVLQWAAKSHMFHVVHADGGHRSVTPHANVGRLKMDHGTRERRRPRRRLSILATLGLVAAMLLAGVASPAGAITFDNACTNSVVGTQANLVPVTMTATSPASVSPGASVTLSNINQQLTLPPGVFVAGYNLGLLTTGTNSIPITNIHTKIEGTNTVESTQFTNNATATAMTTITDPDGTPGTGDETATPATVNVTYADQTWTAGASGTIDFREDTVTPLGVNNGGIVINALIGGFFAVQYRCSPGTVVEGADPSTIVFTDPAAVFASTDIEGQSPNQAPTADAGPDQQVASGATVNLDGTGSSDPDNDPLTFAWTQTGGPSVILTGATTATPSFAAPTGPASLTFQLEVCDGEPLCDTDTVAITVVAPNQVPTADAGPDQTVASGASVNLDGTGSSDPDGDPLTYAWTQIGGPSVTLTGATTAMPSFTAPTGPTTLVFDLEVCDGEPLCDTNAVAVTVGAPIPVFLGFTQPLPMAKFAKSAPIMVKFRLGDDAGVPLSDLEASQLQTQVTLSANPDGSNPLSLVTCAYSKSSHRYQCSLKAPKSVAKYPTPYYVTAYELIGANNVKAPTGPSSTTDNPVIIYFK